MKPWLIAFLTLPLAAGPVAAQQSPVSVTQVPRPSSAAPIAAPQNIDQARARATQRDGVAQSAAAAPAPTLLTRENVQACRQAQLGAAPPGGVDCDEVNRLYAQRSAELSAEGSLLNMIGERNSITRPESVAERAIDADSVARQLSSGDVQGTDLSGDAGAIAARQRPVLAPNVPR